MPDRLPHGLPAHTELPRPHVFGRQQRADRVGALGDPVLQRAGDLQIQRGGLGI
jgi:hypothetical protein